MEAVVPKWGRKMEASYPRGSVRVARGCGAGRAIVEGPTWSVLCGILRVLDG